MNAKQAASLRVVRNVEDDLNDQMELISPLKDINGINDPINEIAVPMEVDAHSLYVDHSYQRDRSEESQRRVIGMVKDWDWSLFERPLVWEDDKGRHNVIDGQHTALAWVSHPDLPAMIPVNKLMNVKSAKQAAKIFMGRNMNRIRLHHLQEYKSALVAEEEWALELHRLASQSGIRIPFSPEFAHTPNTVMALRTLLLIIDRHGFEGAKRVLSILTQGMLRPMREAHLKAMAFLLFEPQFKGQFQVEKLKAVMRATNDNLILGKAIQEAVETRLTRWESLANLYRKEYQSRFGVEK